MARQLAVMYFHSPFLVKKHMWWTISELYEHVTFISSIYIEAAFFGFVNNPKCVLLSTAQMFRAD